MDTNKLSEEIKFDDNGLVVAVAQDYKTNEVLMVAYMNKEALEITLKEKRTCYYSRSRKSLWRKGETSGNIQYLKGIYYDCDGDAILMKVDQIGNACHTGAYSCFFNKVYEENVTDQAILNKVYGQIINRRDNPKEGSYTNYLFDKGLDKILKKVGEETSEVIIGAKNKNKDELVYEMCDLIYHSLVLMVNEGVVIDDLKKELTKRHK
ncbi:MULTISPECIES: bifunctional phosphoribosyl-AMP cyclohydrolase/phosphoribosyl-ATP diphosphatase HisIE [unclassified Sedimentibacter]|uniref:bifunctional phosphoribosyl-AMP cyclohydrolase/phosphoribosyl-ATP diphosphatase HisIE n=1 Tax=unclassified Sedimentibacter TaxID=2649220 RepID=UPI0027DF8613|nr:bifunctional phosphoribosyl-AMP cyclohydrolase/phosphoribosyl-ATP diphosphatase HisIE [Sedimentibacter sp. MB35-C1]WMJ78024.1 bifunctional phosphoribosyl-AMP cyclohydrolase/phosphoribosyl-ATP diphosphatase HisIE [Sedimentibacter sp. MB35-C1]